MSSTSANRTQQIAGEFFGTALLVCVVVGSGIMGTALSPDAGVALLVNAVSTVLVLGLLISVLGPVSGAHFNPVVTLVMFTRREISAAVAVQYIVAQILGAISGAVTANVMFDLDAINISTKIRDSVGMFVGEVIATAGLVAVILIFIAQNRAHEIRLAVPAWIGSAYFFTSSTSFANPAVTVGRVFSDTFAGIAPSSVAGFIAAQVVGAFLGVLVARSFVLTEKSPSTDSPKENHV